MSDALLVDCNLFKNRRIVSVAPAFDCGKLDKITFRPALANCNLNLALSQMCCPGACEIREKRKMSFGKVKCRFDKLPPNCCLSDFNVCLTAAFVQIQRKHCDKVSIWLDWCEDGESNRQTLASAPLINRPRFRQWVNKCEYGRRFDSNLLFVTVSARWNQPTLHYVDTFFKCAYAECDFVSWTTVFLLNQLQFSSELVFAHLTSALVAHLSHKKITVTSGRFWKVECRQVERTSAPQVSACMIFGALHTKTLSKFCET